MSTATLRTGQTIRYKNNNPWFYSDDKWAVVDEIDGLVIGQTSRRNARLEKHEGGRIARVIKVTPKTVTVEISK